MSVDWVTVPTGKKASSAGPYAGRPLRIVEILKAAIEYIERHTVQPGADIESVKHPEYKELVQDSLEAWL